MHKNQPKSADLTVLAVQSWSRA